MFCAKRSTGKMGLMMHWPFMGGVVGIVLITVFLHPFFSSLQSSPLVQSA